MHDPVVGLEVLAEVSVAIEAGEARAAVLAARGIEPGAFDASMRTWLERIATAADRGHFDLGVRWASLRVAARSPGRLGPRSRAVPFSAEPSGTHRPFSQTAAPSSPPPPVPAPVSATPPAPAMARAPLGQRGTAPYTLEGRELKRSMPFVTSPGEGAVRRAEAFSLAQYARLMAEERVDPVAAVAKRTGYGIDADTWSALTTVWTARMDMQPALRTRLETQVMRLEAKIRAGEI